MNYLNDISLFFKEIILVTPLYKAIFYVLLSMAIAKISDIIFTSILRRMAGKTENSVDDKIIDTLHKPIYYTILFIGLGVSTSLIDFFNSVQFVINGSLKTLVVVIWGSAVFKSFILNRYKNNKYILFYDSDCGFCHYSIRIIKRLDVFQRLVFADKNYIGKKPKSLDDALSYTALLYNPSNEKIWLRHEVFGKILIILPFGFLLGWIFFIPGVSIIFRKIYDIVALKRTDISKYFGLPACDLKTKLVKENSSNDFIIPYYKKNLIYIKKTANVFVLLIIFWSSINYSLAANDGVNDLMEDYGFGKNYFKHNQTLKKIAYYPRMIQRWNMFSPTVLSTDKVLIIEATLSNGDIIDPFTGVKPVLDSVDYDVLWHDHNQFWRKFSSRVTKKGRKSVLNRFETWLKRYNNTYFDDNLYGNRIREVKIWSLSQRNKDINSKANYRVSKKLLNSKQSTKSKAKPVNRKKN